MENYPFPLDTFIDEEVEVPTMTVKLDSRGNPSGLEETVTKKTIKTMYSKIDPVPFSCKSGSHKWKMTDRVRHIATCVNPNCLKNRFLRAVYEYIDKDGKLRDRDTNEVID